MDSNPYDSKLPKRQYYDIIEKKVFAEIPPMVEYTQLKKEGTSRPS